MYSTEVRHYKNGSSKKISVEDARKKKKDFEILEEKKNEQKKKKKMKSNKLETTKKKALINLEVTGIFIHIAIKKKLRNKWNEKDKK